MRFSSLLIGVIGLTFSLSAQETASNWKFIEAQVMSGVGIQLAPLFTEKEVANWTQNDPWMIQDFTGYEQFSGLNRTTSAQFSAYVGFRKESRFNPMIRAGISYKRLNSQVFGRYQLWSGPYDTLVSTQTGQVFYTDTSRMHSMSGFWGADVLALDASYLLQTDPSRRWSFYGGIGLQAGLLFNQQIQLTRMEIFSESGLSNTMDVQVEQRSYRMNTGLSSTLYLPLGIDFRVGKKRPLWQQVHLVYELRPSLSFQTMSSVSLVSPGLSQHFGLRITI
jgi:hypothetical protein